MGGLTFRRLQALNPLLPHLTLSKGRSTVPETLSSSILTLKPRTFPTATMSPPAECKAIIVRKVGHAEVTTVPVPKLRDDYLLVRTLAVALNPTDHKAIDGKMGGDDSSLAGCRPGCDYVGVVEEVGPRVTKPFARGDRVAGVAHGCNLGVPEDGAFAEWIVVKGDLAILVPENVSDAEAATLGIGVTTVVSIYPSSLPPVSSYPSLYPSPNGSVGMFG